MFYLEYRYLIFLSPAILLGLWAQFRMRSTYRQALEVPTALTGAAAARKVLDSAGLNQVEIEMVPGELSDHYDPRHKVLRLSPDVYGGRTAASVGVAAHEAGHALQDAENYSPLVLRNLAVPVAGFGSGAGLWIVFFGAIFSIGPLIWLGIALYSCFVAFQLVNLPVEFNASSRAKAQLAMLDIADRDQMYHVNRMLNAAALTYVAATLSAVMTLLYWLYRLGLLGGSSDE